MNFADYIANTQQSIRLKALGFNEPTWTYSYILPDMDSKLRIDDEPQDMFNYPNRPDYVIRPLYTQIWDWTLLKHGIYVEVFPIEVSAGETMGFRWQWTIIDATNMKANIIANGETHSLLGYLTRSLASSAALDGLIRILEGRQSC